VLIAFFTWAVSGCPFLYIFFLLMPAPTTFKNHVTAILTFTTFYVTPIFAPPDLF